MQRTSRREFLCSTALAAGGLAMSACGTAGHPPRAARDKLRIGVVGAGGRGRSNLMAVAGEDVVALCDVDRRRLDRASRDFPDAWTFVDYRELLAMDGLDAVVVSTPDHTHAGPAAMALRRGLDVYCEKPLTHTVIEARLLQTLAERHGCVTQMGTQIHSLPNYRRVVELVKAGAIGPVREVHVFVSSNWSGDTRAGAREVPEWLEWDLWLGPADRRRYYPAYHPEGWRRYWDFGGGTMADMACHYMDLAFWALGLGHPETVRAFGPPPDREVAPPGLRVDYRFPARGEQPPVELTWYDADMRPDVLAPLGLQGWRNGVLFLGSEGRWLIADYTRRRLGPAERFTGFSPPPRRIPESIGHHAEWIAACKARTLPTCHFGYSGVLTQAVLLGTVSHRAGNVPLRWEGNTGSLYGSLDAQAFLHRHYRDGWAL